MKNKYSSIPEATHNSFEWLSAAINLLVFSV